MSSQSRFPRPVAWSDRLILRAAAWEQCEGVPVAVGVLSDEARLRRRVAEALRLLATHAPEDLTRIRQLMRGILVARLYGANAAWRQAPRLCVISPPYLTAETSTPAVAATIIHELMHARLDALGFEYKGERRARIERICFRASQRFLEKLPDSPHRASALREIEELLSFDTGVWGVVLTRDYRPWYLRVASHALRPFTFLWRR